MLVAVKLDINYETFADKATTILLSKHISWIVIDKLQIIAINNLGLYYFFNFFFDICSSPLDPIADHMRPVGCVFEATALRDEYVRSRAKFTYNSKQIHLS
jgi:hypothetical protein